MRSAPAIYRVGAVYGLLGAAVVAVGLAVAIRGFTWSASPNALWEACRGLIPGLTAGSWLVLGLVTLATVAAARGTRSLLRGLRAQQRLLGQLAGARGLDLHGHPVILFDDARPRAFCAGLLRPRIYVSRGALAALAGPALDAVLAHEAHHRQRRDPLRLLAAAVLGQALFFLPGMASLADRYAAAAEVAADAAAVRSAGDPAPLASALLAFGEVEPSGAVAIAPDRVDGLMGMQPRWALPRVSMSGGLALVAGLAGLVVLAARTVAPGAVSLPLVVNELCMVGMGLVVGVAALALIRLVWRRLGARRADGRSWRRSGAGRPARCALESRRCPALAASLSAPAAGHRPGGHLRPVPTPRRAYPRAAARASPRRRRARPLRRGAR